MIFITRLPINTALAISNGARCDVMREYCVTTVCGLMAWWPAMGRRPSTAGQDK
jgi:hypothetical protein